MNEPEIDPNDIPFCWEEPEEDAAWKYLENDKDDAATATVQGSEATMRRLWNTPEEDAAWAHLQDN